MGPEFGDLVNFCKMRRRMSRLGGRSVVGAKFQGQIMIGSVREDH